MEYNYQVESALSSGNVFFSSVVDFGAVHLEVQHVTGNPVLHLTRSVAQNTERRWGRSRKAFQCQGGSSMWKVPWEVLFERLCELYTTKITFLALCL